MLRRSQPVARAAARLAVPALLELGGESASLVLPDVNLDYAAAVAVYSSIVGLSGQGCAMPTRLLVHDSVDDAMVEKVSAVTAAIKLGDPFDPTVSSRPVGSEDAQTRVLGMMERAQSEGAGTLLAGGRRPGGDLERGYYVEPTVLGDVDPASEIARVEVFGPVLAVPRLGSDDEGLKIANSTGYGLASYLWTSDLRRMQRITDVRRAGGVYVNGGCPLARGLPFGGVGFSGLGREGGREGLYEFARTEAVAIGRSNSGPS